MNKQKVKNKAEAQDILARTRIAIKGSNINAADKRKIDNDLKRMMNTIATNLGPIEKPQ